MSAATTSTVPTPVDSPKIVAKNDKGDESKKKKKKERTRKRAKRNPRKRTLKTKVIVRRLPPNLPEDIFMNTVKPWITEENTDYSLYVAGKFAKR